MGSEEVVVLMLAVPHPRSVCECSMRSAVSALSVARRLAVGRGTAAPVSGCSEYYNLINPKSTSTQSTHVQK